MKYTPYFSALFLMFSITSLLPSAAWTKDSISWMESATPPFFIQEGDFKGQGYVETINNILIENLPGYNHTRIQANLSRHYQQWKQGEKSCAPSMYKTKEREEFVYFSVPSTFSLPIVLIINKKNFLAFGGSKTVSLTNILQSDKFVIGRINNRSFGAEFDNTLDNYGNDKNTFVYEGPDLLGGLFKMLMAGRIDALPGSPEEAIYLAETMGIRDQIMTLNIEENQNDPEAYLGYIACSKNEWGKTAINNINQVLLEQRGTERYRAAYERWLDPSSLEGYRKLYKEVFLPITQ
jgi:uncharacterized protein (TIGR02285 family)